MSTNSVFPEITDAVIAAMKNAPNHRLREILTSVICHLHEAIREVRPSESEWSDAIGFLTRTGQICSDARQEFILLSDTLGVSMLVDAINHEAPQGITPSTVFGPFYTGRQPELPAGASILKREEPLGSPTRVEGRVLDRDGAPLAGALIEVWQAAPNELYDVQDSTVPPGHLRASFRSAEDGSYNFRTVLPVSYPIPGDGPVGQMLKALGRHPYRPAHLHFLVTAPGYRRLVTHIFISGNEYLASDAVFGVKPDLIVSPEQLTDGLLIKFDITLAAETSEAPRDGAQTGVSLAT